MKRSPFWFIIKFPFETFIAIFYSLEKSHRLQKIHFENCRLHVNLCHRHMFSYSRVHTHLSVSKPPSTWILFVSMQVVTISKQWKLFSTLQKKNINHRMHRIQVHFHTRSAFSVVTLHHPLCCSHFYCYDLMKTVRCIDTRHIHPPLNKLLNDWKETGKRKNYSTKQISFIVVYVNIFNGRNNTFCTASTGYLVPGIVVYIRHIDNNTIPYYMFVFRMNPYRMSFYALVYSVCVCICNL